MKQNIEFDSTDLLDGLRSLGCGIKEMEGSTYVSLPDEFAEFVFEPSAGWLYVGTTFMTPDEVSGNERPGTLDRFLLELHDRSIGCQFSYDRAGYLCIGTEIHPGLLAANTVLDTMEQIAMVIEVCWPLCDRLVATGDAPTDKEIDDAFGLSNKLH